MSAVNLTSPQLKEQTDRDELAGAKLWLVYRHGDTWQTGLFSASLTVFIIESYKNLSQDPDEV
ncbi:hypothetical protein B0H13DRAFT_2301069 [Mycena leptocephala]|nr:hypothetical protein B0H13DRAFT_2301069 [Mycena leptocephala]